MYVCFELQASALQPRNDEIQQRDTFFQSENRNSFPSFKIWTKFEDATLKDSLCKY